MALTVGVGLTVIENVCAVPEQEFDKGVITIKAVTGKLETFTAVNAAIFPAPLAARPIEAAVLVQL